MTSVRDGELFIKRCFNNGEDHDFEQINKHIICTSILEVEYECLKCGHSKLEYEEIIELEISFKDEWLEPSHE